MTIGRSSGDKSPFILRGEGAIYFVDVDSVELGSPEDWFESLPAEVCEEPFVSDGKVFESPNSSLPFFDFQKPVEVWAESPLRA
jgi:hypothetical protein